MTPKNIISALIFLTVFAISCNDRREQSDTTANSNNVFVSIDYDKAVGYSYEGDGGIQIIDKQGNLAKEIKKQINLDKRQTIRLTNILCDKSTYGGDVAACFDPHFGLVLYKTNKPVAFVSICLDCNYLISSITIPQEAGFSNDGVKNIMNFERELKFY